MTDDASPENLRKFLESDDPAMVRMGLSMAKGSGVPDEMLEEILWMYMLHDDKTIRAAAKSTFIKLASEDAKQAVKENWKASYRKHWHNLGILGKALCQTSVSLVGLLIKALRDKYIIERRHDGMKVSYYISPIAAQALGIIGDERAVEPLIKALKDDDEGGVYFKRLSNYAAEALGKIGESAVEPLIEALGDENDNVRHFTAKALRKVGDARAVEPLIGVLSDDKRFVRRYAAEALGEIGDKRAVEPLIKVFGDDISQLRKSAAGALDKLGWVPETDGQRAAYLMAVEDWKSLVEWGEPAVEPLIKALGDNNSGVRKSAAEALEKLGWKPETDGQKAAYLISNAVPNSPKWGTLVELGEPAVEPLIKALGWLGNARKSAAGALDKLGWVPEIDGQRAAYLMAVEDWKLLVEWGEPAVEPLIRVLGDGVDNVRRSAAKALGEIGDGRAVKPLIKALGSNVSWESSSYKQARKSAAVALGKIGKPAVEPLIKALGDDDNDVRKAAAKPLGEIGDTRAVEPLIKALSDDNQWIRRSSAEALGKISDTRAVGPLIGVLSDNDRFVRRYAAEALGEIGDKRAVEPLIKALEDEEDDIRWHVAVALGNIGDARAIEPLIKVLGDDNWYVRDCTTRALEKLGHEVE